MSLGRSVFGAAALAMLSATPVLAEWAFSDTPSPVAVAKTPDMRLELMCDRMQFYPAAKSDSDHIGRRQGMTIRFLNANSVETLALDAGPNIAQVAVDDTAPVVVVFTDPADYRTVLDQMAQNAEVKFTMLGKTIAYGAFDLGGSGPVLETMRTACVGGSSAPVQEAATEPAEPAADQTGPAAEPVSETGSGEPVQPAEPEAAQAVEPEDKSPAEKLETAALAQSIRPKARPLRKSEPEPEPTPVAKQPAPEPETAPKSVEPAEPDQIAFCGVDYEERRISYDILENAPDEWDARVTVNGETVRAQTAPGYYGDAPPPKGFVVALLGEDQSEYLVFSDGGYDWIELGRFLFPRCK